MNKILTLCLSATVLLGGMQACTQGNALPKSLVPDTPSKAPDYFCTWNIQGYATSYQGSDRMRADMNEQSLFGTGQYEGWVNFFPKIREDLYFVMDDSWDIPQDVNTKTNPYLGMAELDTTRFPSFTGAPKERLKQLTDKIKSYGWKGAGGWICAQEAEVDPRYKDIEAYWTAKLQATNYAGFDYWKVDWGSHSRDGQWRKTLTDLGKTLAPNLWMEHALAKGCIAYSDVYRTYDIENIIAVPVTLQRIAEQLAYQAQPGYRGIINCEDEPYIAAALGCAIGVMRHPFAGNLPDGRQDHAFPPVGRNLKTRIDEVVRAVRWHRIAEPFGVDGKSYAVDGNRLEDYWTLGKDETWNKSRPVGSVVKESAPARVSRCMPLVEVSDSTSTDRPFILASRYPNGATAVASIGRALDREYYTKEIGVTFAVAQPEAPIGIFGRFASVTITLPEGSRAKDYEIYAQDLAADKAENISKKVTAKGNSITLPGELINRVGLATATEGDLSDPGLVVRFFKKGK